MLKTNRQMTSLAGLLILSATALTAGCAMGISHFDRSVSVSDTFENYRPLPDHQYYYNGLPYSPDAVVAIRKGYTLNSPYWHATDATEQKLRQWIREMLNNPGAEYNLDPNGANIFNDKGEIIGAWYSVWDFPLLKFISPTEFSISNPMTVFPPSNADPEKSTFPPFFW